MTNVLRWSEDQFAAHKQRTKGGTSLSPACALPAAKGIEPSPYARMNKTETEYAKILESRKARGEILWWVFERYTLTLANNTRYTPDFVLMLSNGVLECHEVKGGFIREDGWLKLKLAASAFPHPFLLCQKKSKKDGGGWEIKEVGRL